MARKIKEIIIHCSGSERGNAREIDKWHRKRGWKGIGYHFVILNGLLPDGVRMERLDGAIECGRPVSAVGAHAKGRNLHSIGICVIGERDFTVEQLRTLIALVVSLKHMCGADVKVLGHCELPGVTKTCPNLDIGALRLLIRSAEGC